MSGTDPLKDKLPLRQSRPLAPGDSELLTAKLVNALSEMVRQLLEKHEINAVRRAQGLPTANVVLLRGAGSPAKIPSFKERWGIQGSVIAPTRLVKGIAVNAGMEIVDVEGATGDYHSNYNAKIESALGLLKKGRPFIFVHFKGVDESCHDKDQAMKQKMLEKIDQALARFAEGLARYPRDVLICLTGDHSSPVSLGEHSFEPVPLCITSSFNLQADGPKSLPADEVKRFGEVECAAGALGRTQGAFVMEWLLAQSQSQGF